MAFTYSPKHMDTISFCFVQMPDIKMKIEAAVLQNKESLVSKVLAKLVEFAVRFVIKSKLTLPCMKTKWFLNKVFFFSSSFFLLLFSFFLSFQPFSTLFLFLRFSIAKAAALPLAIG